MSTISARTLSYSLRYDSSSHAGPPKSAISWSAAAIAQSSNSAWMEPCGFAGQGQLLLVGQLLATRTSPGSPGCCSRISRRVPLHIACCCSASVSKSRTETVSPSSTSAGYAFTGWPARRVSKTRVSVPIVQSVRPVRSRDSPPVALGGGRRGLGERLAGLRLQAQLQRLQVLVLGELAAPLVDDPEGDPQVVGDLRPVEVVGRRTGTPTIRCSSRASVTEQRLLQGHRPRPGTACA